MGLLSLIAKLGLDTGPFDRGLGKASSSARKWGDNVGRDLKGRLGAAFGVAAVTAATKHVIDFGSHLVDMAKRTGISTTALQEFQYAASQNGSSLDTVVRSVERLAVAQVNAIDGQKRYVETFERFGISLQELRGLRPEDLFRQIARQIQENGLQGTAAADALQLMGESAGEILPAMRNGFAAAAEEAHRLGTIVDGITLQNLKQAGDDLTRAKATSLPVLASVVSMGVEAFSIVGKVADKLTVISQWSPVGLLAQWLGKRSVKRNIEMNARAAASETPTRPVAIVDPEDAKRAKKVLDLRQKLQEKVEDFQFSQLSTEEKLNKLYTERVLLAKQIKREGDEETRLQLGMKLVELDKKAADLNKQSTEASAVRFQHDSLAQIGGFIGSAGRAHNPVADLVRQQLEVQRQIASNTDPTRRSSAHF